MSFPPSKHAALLWMIGPHTYQSTIDPILEELHLRFAYFTSLPKQTQTIHPQIVCFDVTDLSPNQLTPLKQLKQQQPDVILVALAAQADLGFVLQLFEAGVFDYLLKPINPLQFKQVLRRAINAIPTTDSSYSTHDGSHLIGQSSAMQDVFRTIAKLRHSKTTVLIQGESGTGKEHIAQAIHTNSPVAKGSFVAINTAAIPSELLESELFGHEKGAFTGATQTKLGYFEQAKQGTLFLDEIGDMPLALQTRFLRVLSSGYYQRLGGQQPIPVETRIIAATHQPLKKLVEEGRFREDLYHRLHVIQIDIPPLRERPEDIALFVAQFLSQKAEPKYLSTTALKHLQKYHFPGNVRELKNICEWLSVMVSGSCIEVQDLPKHIHTPKKLASNTPQNNTEPDWEQTLSEWIKIKLQQGSPNLMAETLSTVESLLINTALDSTQGRKIEAAKRLGIGRNTLSRKIGIKK
jgi:two-component system nitrogen regulation response regulator GlnG